MILRELRSDNYGRCVFRYDNDAVDRQIVLVETNNGITISLSIDAFTLGDQRETHIRMTHGEIDDNERSASANSEAAKSRHTTFRDFSESLSTPEPTSG